MVYCGVYTEDGSKFTPDLRDALEKLQLNDASLSFEPGIPPPPWASASAAAFGYAPYGDHPGAPGAGVRPGSGDHSALGHPAMGSPRPTAPWYRWTIPTTTRTRPIEEAREPFAKGFHHRAPDYVGNIMPMCQERRAEFKDMQYLDTNLVELHYSMPLNEIIYDFFDALKANTKGLCLSGL